MAETGYDKIIEMITNLDLQDDGIKMNHKIKSIMEDYCRIIEDETMLSNSMEYINNQVLNSNDASLKFALLFSSHFFDALAMNDTKVRCKMLNLLQKNFAASNKLREEDKNRLYNSITLLGEYYHRVKLADGSAINILGQSLLDLLIKELKMEEQENSEKKIIDIKLAKLILSQVTLNGRILRSDHKNELDKLLFYVRKSLIEIDDLENGVKALLLMTLDLYYSNFTSLTPILEEMYTKYLVEEEKSKKDDNKTIIPRKKWSEEVNEDSVFENEVNNDFSLEEQSYQSLPTRTSEEQENFREFKRESSTKSPNYRQNWQNSNKMQHQKFNNRRYSGNYDEDGNRSDGGSMKLYNVNDRIRYNQPQDKWERNSNIGSFHSFNGDRRSSSRNSHQQQYENNFRNSQRNNYDRPPRFRNSETWRPNGFEVRPDSRGPPSRSSSRNCSTLPRPNKPTYAGSQRSVSPETSNNRNFNFRNSNSQNRPQQSRNFGRTRYGSNTSLASDNTGERRGRRNSRRYSQDWRDERNEHDWEDNSPKKQEIVNNARNTSKYLKYLSEQN